MEDKKITELVLLGSISGHVGDILKKEFQRYRRIEAEHAEMVELLESITYTLIPNDYPNTLKTIQELLVRIKEAHNE